MSHNRSNKQFTLALTGLLLLSLLIRPLITFAHEGGVLEQAQQRAIEVGAYDFVAEVEQTLVPRPLPSMIGRTDERVDMHISGQVTLPDQARLRLHVAGAGLDTVPVTLVQEGSETYLLKEGKKTPVQNPANLIAPTGDYLTYLAAAENVQPCPTSPPKLGGTEGGLPSPPELGGTEGGLVCYTYDINGYRFAEHVRERAQAELEHGESPPPPGVELQPSPLLQRTSGHGQVWLDENGLPVRQKVFLSMPEASEYYDSQVHVVVDFRFDERAIQQQAARLDGRRILNSVKDGLAGHIAPTDLYCLLLSFLLASLLFTYRRRRWMYGLIAVSVSLIMVATPLLQAANFTRFQEHLAQAADSVQTLAEAFSSHAPGRSVVSSQSVAAQSVSTSVSSPEVYCGAGDLDRDIDGDGLNDAAEYCLGTNPYYYDSDYDLITDTVEADGFTFGGRTWPGDPVNPDANGDGLTDGEEWPKSAGGNATSWDLDNDGVPNPWDDDNDGDGVPDGRDLTPSSYGASVKSFDLNLTGGFGGHVYIELQVQPGNVDHLRYDGATLDWPDDFKGQIQDRDKSTEDVRLLPKLEVFANRTPSEALREKYGPISVFKNKGDASYPYRMLLSLSPVSDGARTMAFHTRLVYGPEEMTNADLRWKDARIVWMVMAKIDRENDSGDVVVENTPIHTYAEPSLRITGFKVTKSRDYVSAIFGIPDNEDDRQLFNLLFGLSSTWLTHEKPDFAEIDRRFTSGLTDPVEKWGVTAGVELHIPSPSAHRDLGIASFNARVKNFLNDHYAAEEYASLVIATEEEIGSDNLGGTGQLGAKLNVNLTGVTLITRRMLQLQVYEQNSDWKPVVGRDLLQIVSKRQTDSLQTALDDMSETYPGLTGRSLFALTQVFYLAWQEGRSTVIAIDGQPIVSEMRSDLEVYNQIGYQDGKFDARSARPARTEQTYDPLATYLVEAGNFAHEMGEQGGELIIGGVNEGWQYTQAYAQQSYDLGVGAAETAMDAIGDAYDTAVGEVAAFGAAVYDVIPTDEQFYEGLKVGVTSNEFNQAKKAVIGTMTVVDTGMTIAKIAGEMSKAAKAMKAGQSSADFAKAVGSLGEFSAPGGLAVATLALDLGLTWGQFAIAGDYSEGAIANAIASTILSLVLFVIGLNPIGAVLVAIFSIIDLILDLCCGISISGEMTKAIAALIYDVDVLSKMGDYDFVKPDNDLVYPDMGFIKGNRFQIAAQFEGDIVKGEPQGWVSEIVDFVVEAFGAKLVGSYAYGEYDGAAGSGVTAVEKNASHSCSVQGEKKECSNRVKVEYQLNSPGRNRELRYKRLIRAKTYWLIIRVWKAFLFGLAGSPIEVEAKDTKYPEDLKEKDRWDFDTLYLDVLPDTLDGLWNWSEVVNHDPDADGLSNSQESRLGSNPNKWDSDGDGLSDRFEFEKQEELGTNLVKYDTDGDGLEFSLNTRIDKQDSDQDGLKDGEEVYHRNQNGSWSGGWEISLPNESGKVWVFSDPLNADADNDTLNDGVEENAASSPHAYNEAPRITLEIDPLNTSPSGVTGVYVEPGDTVVVTATLLSLPPYGVDDALSICLPSFMTDFEASDLQGDRTPAIEQSSCGGPRWVFDDATDDNSDDALRFFETVSATITITIQSDLSQSVTGTMKARLPYGTNKPYDEVQEVLVPVAVDLDDPEATIVSPSEGELIGGGVEHYVIGGSSSDETSWVDHVDVGLPVVGTETLTRSQSLSPWAYTWELPDDGVYTLTARAYDFVGRASITDAVEVMVDNTTATSTVNLEEGAVYGPPQGGAVITITLAGEASDNFSGLTRVQISADDGPWRTVWRLEEATITDTTFVTLTDNFHDLALTATWDAVWTLPNVESVQGYHSLRVRAFDVAGNTPQVLERTIIVDVIPPTSELVNRSYLYHWPHTKADEPHTFHGVANDAGNVSAPSRPADLNDDLDVLDDATTWLGLSTIEDNDEGVSIVWLGDVNNDRRADLAVGLPAAEDGAGRVALVYGRAGDWPVPPDLEMLAESRSSFIGEAGAGIGAFLAAAGDVNGDGYDDLLVGDPDNDRVFLVFGSPLPLGRDVLLDGPWSAERSVIVAPAGEGIGEEMAAAGDVNGDNFDDMLIGTTTATTGTVYLLLGHVGPWWETVELDLHAAATISGTNGARLSSAGDVNGDFNSEFALATGNRVYLFEGQGSFTRMALEELTLDDAVDFFVSNKARPPVAALGDVNGDDYDDFVYADDDGTALVVFGDADLHTTGTTHDTGYDADFVAAAGNVNDPDADAFNDILIGESDGDVHLILGSDAGLGSAEATLRGVEIAASALYAAGADLNSDGSSDLLLVATEIAAQGAGYASPLGRAPHISPAWLPHAPHPSFPSAHQPSYGPSSILATCYVDDDGGCDGQTPCDSSIQDAVDDPGCDEIIVLPGVYSSFTVNGKDNLTIRGAHPDAVFVDGGGGSHVAKIEGDADGVRLENLTLRNASYGVHLDNAGDPANKTVLDTLFIHDLTEHAVYMNHTSAVSLTRCTIVGEGDTIEVYGGPASDPAWSTVSTDSRAATRGGGGLVASGGDLYVLTGGGSGALHSYDGASWATLTSATKGFEHGSVAADGGDGRLYVVRGGLLGEGVNGPVYAVAVASNGDVYVGGEFTEAYNPGGAPASVRAQPLGPADTPATVNVNNVARWDGNQWHDLANGVVESGFSADPNRPRPAQVNAIAIVGSNVYVGGRFTKAGGFSGKDAFNVAKWDGSTWWALTDTDVDGVDAEGCGSPRDPAMCDVFVADIAVDGSNVYVGGAFSRAGDERTGPIAVYNGSSWSALGDVHWDGPVRALVVLGGSDVYVGGNFKQAGGNGANRVAHWNGSGWSGLGSGLNNAVHALAVSGSNVYVGGNFTQAGGSAANYVALWNGSSWSPLGSGMNGPAMGLALDGSDVYVGGSFTQAGGSSAHYLARWNSGWSKVAEGVGAEPGVTQTLTLRDLAISGGEVYAGGEFRPNVARAGSKSYRYSISGNSWSEFSSPPQELGGSVALIGDGSGQRLYALASKKLYNYTISSGTWAELASPPDGLGVGGVLGWADDSIYALRGGRNEEFYRYDPALGRWFTLSSAPYYLYAGGALAWDGQHWFYALHGDNGKQFTDYHIPTNDWTVLGDGNTSTVDDDAPARTRAGGGLAFIENEGALYAVPGDELAELWKYNPVADYPEKLALERTLFVAPETSTGVAWINLPFPPHDFYFTSSDSAWVGGANTVFSPTLWPNPWSPPPLYLDGNYKTVYGQAQFVNLPHEFYRLGEDSVLNGLGVGYHTYRGDARVAPSGAEFTSIQDAIYSGAGRVVVELGEYEEPFYLANGVEVIGAGADLAIVKSPSSDVLAVARAEGVMDASLSRVTLNGDDQGVNGIQVEDGAQNIIFARSIVRGADTGILVDRADTDLEVVNNTVVQNTDGMDATNCASVDARNTIFAYHTGAGLSYQGCASTKLHTYNLFWANGDDFGAAADAGAAELFLDPLFVDIPDHDYRTLDVSPVIDAGDPSDPAPPGAGGRVDIGYTEQGRVSYYVDDDYCELCPNDGLTWQLSAFDVIQDALDQAAEDLALLDVAADEAPQFVVGVGAGVYTETVTVPSHAHLMGAASSTGAEETTVVGGVIFDGATQAEVSDLTITGAGAASLPLYSEAGSPGVVVRGASNEIVVTRNIIRGNSTGVAFSERATGRVTFNTIVSNTGAGVWASVNGNILSGNGTGLSASSNGHIFGDYNLLHDHTADYDGVAQGDHDIVGQNPQFQPGTYRITANSPALDAASTLADVPQGGGERADMGYRELLAAPISIFLGQQDLSTVMGNAGVGEVEYSVVPITDTGRPVTDTLPTAWTTVTLESKGEMVSYWETVYTPTQESVHRFYSRATDEVDNQETEEEDWYDGSFVADSTLPTVTWLSPPSGSVDRPLELRAEVTDYAAGEFSIEEKDVEFEIDGTIYPAQWAAEPWDEENENARIFRAWVSPTLAAHTAYAVAEDKAGNQTQSGPINFTVNATSPADTVSPTLTVAWPPDGGWVTRTVTFSGTASDGGSGIASVEVSVDGGYTWLLATVDGNDWYLTWEGPEGQEFVSYPGRVRASDQAGNVAATARVFSMDEIPPAGLAPVTFSAPEGAHFDITPTLVITWNAPVDGSGVVTTLLAVNQVSETTPITPVAGLSAARELDANGAWYVHLGARDAAGNLLANHYGPWYVGITDAGTDFGDRRQSIVVDGYLDVENGEWLIGSEFLDDDERPQDNPAFYSPSGDQSFYTTWDGGEFYVAWRGAWWDIDGTLWIYLNAEAGGSNQLISSSPDTGLPFYADYAVEITGPTSGTLWHYGSGWITSTEEWEFAQGQSGDTEIRLPLFDTEDIDVIAFALDDNGQVYAVFPTVNALTPMVEDLPMMRAARYHLADGRVRVASLAAASSWVGYHWDDITVVTDPSAGQPKATSIKLTLDSPQQPAASWGPSSTLTYVVKLENLESYTVADLQLSFTAIPTTALLLLPPVEGAGCVTCTDYSPWWFETDLPPGTTRITITGHLTGDLSSISAVTSIVALESISITPEISTQGALNHQVDGQPPTVTVGSSEFIRRGPRTIVGTADDGDGVGVAGVEVRPQDPSPPAWQKANGTLYWMSVVTVPGSAQHGDPWTLDVRAEDEYSQTSAMQTVTFTVDLLPPTLTLSLPPTATLDLPPALGKLFAEITGTVSDSPTGSRAISVAVQSDCGATATPTPTWRSAIVYEPDDDGIQDWLWLWNVPQDLEEGHVCTLTVQSADTVGNVSTLLEEPQQIMVDTVTPEISATKLITIVSGASPVISGTVSDGVTDGLRFIAHVYSPNGYYSEDAECVEGVCTYVLDTNRGGCGHYKVYAEGRDLAGNSVKQGPFLFFSPCAIGGATIPASAFDLLLPWIQLAMLVGLLLAGAVVFVRKRKR